MPLEPGYGETPVSDDELQWLLPKVHSLFEEPVTKAAVYGLEQAAQVEITETLVEEVLDGQRTLNDLLSDYFLRDLHRWLYGDIWTWAGTYRRHELNIGVDPQQISVQLRQSMDTLRWRWEDAGNLTARQLGIAVHAEGVRIHPFTDGNGRATRLHADLVFIAAQTGDTLERYDWELDKKPYIELLREYDRHRNPTDLAAFIAVQPLSE
ncbi:Fic family protein [Polymorphospora lycopeni]|uniref:Fic family protein n=1 Tax=Polymorphospora lycopeni TaxID=3140240 RepID=A0ABV5CLP5_9ACTN